MSTKEKFAEIIGECKLLVSDYDSILGPFKSCWGDPKKRKLDYRKYSILSSVEWCVRIMDNLTILYEKIQENAYYTMLPLSRFPVELLLNYEVIFLIPKLAKTNFEFVIENKPYKLFEEYKNRIAKGYKNHNEVVKELCRFRTKKTRNSGAKRPDFPVHEDQVFRSKKTNLSTFSGFGCMTA